MRLSSMMLAAMLVALVAMGVTSNELGTPGTWSIPSLPANKQNCLAQFDVGTRAGTIDFNLTDHHECKSFGIKPPIATFQAPAKFHLQRLEPAKCDQTKGVFKSVPLELTTGEDAHIIYRKDGLAHLSGQFTLSSMAGVQFKGRMEAIFRISTRAEPVGTEPCNPENQLEGWLVGSGPGTTTIRAQFTVKYKHGNVQLPGKNRFTVTAAVLNGVVTESH